METLEAIRTRRSIRSLKPDPIPVELLEEVIEAARWAPYGTSVERRHFIVLGGAAKDDFIRFLQGRVDEILPALQEGCSSHQILTYAHSLLPVIGRAPVLVLVYTELSDSGPLLTTSSAAAATMNLLLAAHARGLAGCWTTGSVYLADDISAYLGIEDMRLLAVVPLGYPAHTPHPKPRDREVVHWRGFPGKPEAPRATPPELTVPENPSGAQRVLVVIDSVSVAAWAAQQLRAEGYDVYPLTDPTRALAIFDQWRPHMVLVDAIMAGKSGLDVVKELRERANGLLPIIMGTDTYTPADEEICLAAGADDVIAKPVTKAVLLARVKAHLRTRALYDELQAANEELRRLQKLRDDLTGMIVHDLRGPLTSIMGSLQMLQNSDFEMELVREFVPLSIESGTNLLGMINDLLDVSKMESGAIELDRTQFDLCEVVRAAVEGLRPLALEKGLTLETSCPSGTLPLVADEGFIRRIVTNLVTNSLKFTWEGGVTVVLERSDDGAEALIRVTDTGEGIPEAFRERLFEKFAQAESRKQGKKLGTGLGLTFVKMATEAHGGEVRVESEVGKGSTFIARIPRGLYS